MNTFKCGISLSGKVIVESLVFIFSVINVHYGSINLTLKVTAPLIYFDNVEMPQICC